MRLLSILFAFLCLLCGQLLAADRNPSAYPLTVTPDRADCISQRGEQVAFTIGVALKGAPSSDAKVRWTLSYDGKDLRQTGAAKLVNGQATVTGTRDQPGFLQCRADITPPGEKVKTIRAAVAVDALHIKPSLPAPDDFDAFWARAKMKLAAVPLKVRLTPVKSPQSGVECFDVQADGLGGPLAA